MKPGYKRSEVSVMPSDWMVKPISQVAPLQRGFDLPTREIRPGPFPVVYSNGVENFHSVAMVKGPGVVTGRSGTLGKVHYIGTDYWPHNTSLWVTRFNDNIPKFIYYLYESLSFGRFASGSGVPTLNRNDAHSYRIALPSDRNEQRAIAAALSDVDALLGGLDRFIAKKRDLKQAAMQQLLTGQTRLPGFNGGWEVSALKRFVRTFIVPMRDKPKHLTGDIPWCRIEDFDGMYLADSRSGQRVDTATIRSMNLKVYPAGTLLVSCSADLGRCAIVARPLVSNQTFIGLEMDDRAASNVFFYYLMTSKADELNSLSSGTTISYLTREQFEEFAVVAPLDKHEQVDIAAVLSDMDAELAALEARRDKTRDLKQAMMQELLTGKTRLVAVGGAHA